ncbi:MAG: radical SAM protein, partial [Poseidonibacter sp.]
GIRFKDIIKSDRYWEVMDFLASDKFDACSMCETLCLQDKTNEVLDLYKKGLSKLEVPSKQLPQHLNFI